MIKVDENDPVGELEPSFPYRDVNIRRNVDMKEFYDLEAEIGRGKFGTVYRCREKSTGLSLAAKFVGIAKRQERRSVEKEVEIMRALQHPRLIQLYDALESSNVMCVVLELIEGGELFERVIDDDFILTEKSCSVFVRQICEGVEFIHSKNILHLDLKPENIMCLSKTGNRIKIIDFGLARQFDPEKKLQVLFGTPEFVAPEVVNFDAIGYGTDMWSVGVICYVLLSGLSPFMGETDVETMANVTIAQYDFDDVAFDEISADAKDFIKSLLLKDKERRLTASECLSHKWLRRKLVPRPAELDTTKENIKSVVERWNDQPTSPTVILTLPPDEPKLTPIKIDNLIVDVPINVKELSPPINPQIEPFKNIQNIDVKEVQSTPQVNDISQKTPNIKINGSKEKINIKPEKPSQGEKNSGDLESPVPSKQQKVELTPVKSKGLVHNKTLSSIPASPIEEIKKPKIDGENTKVKCIESKSNNVIPKSGNKQSTFLLKPSPSVPNVINSRVQSGNKEINISKILTQNVRPKISGIVLGQTEELSGKNQQIQEKCSTNISKDIGPKVITHKIHVERESNNKQPSQETVQKSIIPPPFSNTISKPASNPIVIENSKDNRKDLIQSDKIERRASDFSCFLHDSASPSTAQLADEIKNLSTRLFQMSSKHKSLDEDNNNKNHVGNVYNDPIRQFLANHGVVTRRPKHRLTNLNRDVPIGSPPPPSNFSYLVTQQVPPSSSRLPWVKHCSPEIQSAPQSPRISPSRFPEGADKDFILRLFDDSTSVSSSSSIDSLVNYFKTANENQKKVTSAK
uniref:Protein kinase domain-containing protein n=1 Tax=Clastoptera arizonana TaxID=38151 RepID=A0A1B6C5L4_9HEMI